MSESNQGYIYIRSHESYDKYNAYKLGKTQNCIERESSYISGEIKRGEYIFVIQVHIDNLSRIERKLQECFTRKGLHIFHGGGTVLKRLKPLKEG